MLKENLAVIKELTVSELSDKIKSTVESNFGFIKVRGEISGLKLAGSGHCYLNLKDNNSIIAVTIWRPVMSALSIKLEDGLEVLITGRVTTYANMSRYQISVSKIELSGIGSLMQLLEKRKKKLADEGLFDASRKKSLPLLPKKIGIITSLKGAVVKDIIHRVKERCPIVNLIIWPVLVQGEKAANEISEAINGFNNEMHPDVIIVARGGGSVEDLWAFNEEIVVRSTANSKIPIISAVGHETDVTLIDFASDKRAPTPTAAAEFAVPVISKIQEELDVALNKIFYISKNYITSQANLLTSYSNYIKNFANKLFIYQQHIDEIEMTLKRIMSLFIERKEFLLAKYDIKPSFLKNILDVKYSLLQNYWQKIEFYTISNLKNYTNILENLGTKISLLDYKKFLDNGFALIRDNKSKKLISAGAMISIDQEINIEFKDLSVVSRVISKNTKLDK